MNPPTLPNVMSGSGNTDRRVSPAGNMELGPPSLMISAQLLGAERLESAVPGLMPGLRSLLQFPTAEKWSEAPRVPPIPVVKS